MSGRSAAEEVVATLHNVADYLPTSTYEWPEDAYVLRQAADRLAEEDRKRRFFETCNQIAQDKLAVIDALRPPCPTCGGTQMVWIPIGVRKNGMGAPCPDCVDGKVPIERLVKVFEAVHGTATFANTSHSGLLDGWNEAFDHLRGIR